MTQLNFENILTTLYGDNWEIKDSDLIIHYPELIITNSKDLSHKITNLFVKLKLCILNDNVKLNEAAIYGMRTSYSAAEINTNYSHSHLSPFYIDDFTNFTGFCLGAGPIIATLIELTNEITEDNLYFLLYQLNEFVRWESLEGVPYRYIKDIKLGTSNSYNITLPRPVMHEILQKCQTLNFNINEAYIEIVVDHTCINTLKNALYDYFGLANTIFTNIINGRECNIDNNAHDQIISISHSISNITRYFTFKDERFNLTLMDSASNTYQADIPDLTNISIKSNILTQLLNTFNTTLTNYYITTYGTTSYKNPRINNNSKFII